MKNLFFLIFLLPLVSLRAQEIVHGKKSNKAVYSVYLGFGGSKFNSSIAAPSSFPSFEFRVGPTITLPLSSRFELHSRFLFGGKLKREPFNKPGQGYTIPPPFLDLDKVSGSRKHYFIEVPLLIQFNLTPSKLSFYAGSNFRFFMANNNDVDFLTWRKDIGVLLGTSYPISDKWKVGGSICMG